MQVASAYPTASRPLGPGDLVDARFRLEGELGAGGMGTVYAAIDETTGTRVALKLMRPELAGDERAVERFRREGAALAAVRHPAVVQIREVGEAEGTLYIAMELLEGETLSARLERAGPMSAEALLPIVLGLCDGLAAAHERGVIHRDIKPSNIHLPAPDVLARAERTHERVPVKLVDFGVARVAGLSKMTSTGLAIGTVRYMAPEQLTGSAIDERADVYSLGIVIYEALAGEHPFDRTATEDPIGAILVGRATPLSSLRPDLPPAMTRVVHVAMARLATERFASARALAEAFQQAVLEPHAPISDVTNPTPARRAMEYAPTEPVVPSVRPPAIPEESEVRVKQAAKKPKRKPYWLLLPLVTGLCLVPTLGGLGFVGCGSMMTDIQMNAGVRNMRGALSAYPELGPHGAELDQLEALHEADQVNWLAAAAFNARVQHALRGDQHLSASEVVWISEVVRDINEQGGEYSLERYTEMTEQTPATPP
ncbi:MAG: serine/threonine protein kinase [Sandaracinaceae bacterium]|nr:serine/threonine protein kinase [Sandaracinaceae bacterium]